MVWAPTKLQRFIDRLATSTRPIIVQTDAGRAYAKVLGNPKGPHVMAKDYVGTRLAQLIEMPTFDLALLPVEYAEQIDLGEGRRAEVGPALATRAVDGAPWDGTEEMLGLIDNPDAIVGLVVLDTWLRNRDRYPPDGSKSNFGNVFLTHEGASDGRYRLLAIDHGEIITANDEISRRCTFIDAIKDEKVYGLFPAFKPFITKARLDIYSRRLASLDKATVSAVISELPAEWEVDAAAREHLLKYCMGRAEFLADTMTDRAMDQWTLVGER